MTPITESKLPPGALCIEVSEGEWFHYTSCGLDCVYVRGGVRFLSAPYDGWFHFIDLQKVHDHIGVSLLSKDGLLSGAEIRFLRKEIGLTVAEAAPDWGMAVESLIKWESSTGFSDDVASRNAKLAYKSWLNDRVLNKQGTVVLQRAMLETKSRQII